MKIFLKSRDLKGYCAVSILFLVLHYICAKLTLFINFKLSMLV